MTRRYFPGQHTFRIISEESKQAKRRADSQKRKALFRKKHLTEQHNSNLISEQKMVEQAIERYALHIHLKF